MNELRNNQHTDLDLHLCSQACVFVCLFVSPIRARVCVDARRGRWWCAVQRGTREQSPASGEIYCNSSKMADTGESMGVYITESIPRGSTARFTISKTHTTVASPLSLPPPYHSATSPPTEMRLHAFSEVNCLRSLHTVRGTYAFPTICKVNIIEADSYGLHIKRTSSKTTFAFSLFHCG